MAHIKITAIGNVGQDPIVNTLPSGEMVANFSLASTEKWKDKQSGEQRERTEWIRVSAFGGLAKVVAQYVRQGSKLYLEGDYRTSKYTKDGVEHTGVELRLKEMEMLGDPKNQNQHQQGYQNQAPQQGYQNQAPQQGYQNQAPQQGYQNQAPQQGYQNQAPQQRPVSRQQPARQNQGYRQQANYQQQDFENA